MKTTRTLTVLSLIGAAGARWTGAGKDPFYRARSGLSGNTFIDVHCGLDGVVALLVHHLAKTTGGTGHE